MSQTDQPLAALRGRLNELRARKASLIADLERKETLPSTSEVRLAEQMGREAPSRPLQALINQVAEVEERTILYRTAGWTVFEMDLDIGKRARDARREKGGKHGGKGALGLGVRLDTFHDGQFHQPFYLIFAKSSQIVQDGPITPTASTKSPHLRLIRHTIPHFIPLSKLSASYLRLSDDGGVTGALPAADGGLDLLDGLITNDGLSLFLSRLHSYLQSYISRREQMVALQTFALPSLVPSALRAFGSDSFGQLAISWALPVPSKKDLHAFQDADEILYHTFDAPDASDAIKATTKLEGQVNTQIEISVVYHDLSQDRVGRPSEDMSERRKLVEAIGGDETPGLRCAYASVLVECVRSRVPAARRGHSQKHEELQVRKVRRRDWELFFTRAHGASPDLQRSLRAVLDAAWREELQRNLTSVA